MKKGIEIFDYLFILRPTLFYPIWTFYLAGCWGGKMSERGVNIQDNSVGIFWIAVGLTLLMGAIYVLNQIQDVDTDRTNKKLFLIADGIITIKEAYIEAAFLIFISITFSFWVDIRIGIEFLILFILGWLYSFPPARWKNKPFMGLFSNGMLAFICYSIGWLTGGGSGSLKPHMLAYFFAISAVYLNTTLPDIDGDRKTGKITFGVQYGIRKTVLCALIFEIFTFVLAFIFRDWLLFIPAVIVFPLFIVAAVKSTVDIAVRITKFSVLALAISVCIVFPLYLVPVFCVFFISKWYYKIRFNFDYPSFKSY